MTSRDFVIWLRGFTEACNDYTATPKQWDRINEVLEDVEDYDDNPGIDVEIDNYKDLMPLTDTASGSSFSFGAPTTTPAAPVAGALTPTVKADIENPLITHGNG